MITPWFGEEVVVRLTKQADRPDEEAERQLAIVEEGASVAAIIGRMTPLSDAERDILLVARETTRVNPDMDVLRAGLARISNRATEIISRDES